MISKRFISVFVLSVAFVTSDIQTANPSATQLPTPASDGMIYLIGGPDSGVNQTVVAYDPQRDKRIVKNNEEQYFILNTARTSNSDHDFVMVHVSEIPNN